MIDPTVVYEWWIKHSATPFQVSVKFDVPIEEAYALLKAGDALAV